ncbi:hypothetical protein C5167_010430 [Papaver somniferum]|uniref:GDSL esterase/lipase EXL3 n=1 Tax=Papaver somniferum TaxID=3469 RepID=A0A4Y7K434_PAPSO|nr:GDSL esterase/lipase EXL3-like [Papaver somniferum]RZC66745.1 hypothetical protein C5167_010430 [Papaver somniferum]
MASFSCASSTNTISLAIFSLCFLVHQLIQLSAAITLPPNVKVPGLLIFGDSIVDPGNNNNLPTIAKCNFLPYGQDLMGGKPTGRFSNGKVPGDLIAEALGIKDILPAYLDPFLDPNDLLTGVSFASGAAGYDPLTSKLAMAISLEKQVELFKEYLAKVAALAGEAKAKSILSESLYLVVIGSNDLGNTYFGSQLRSNYDIPAYADLMVEGATSFIQDLYDVGARRIGVFGVPPIGCLPSQRTLAGGKARNCAESYNQAAQIFNSKLSPALAKLTAKFEHGRAVYADIYYPILEIIDNPHNYGFEEATKGCCGTGKIESTILCNQLNPFTCDDVSKYIFWDSYHPTERAYRIFLGPFLEKNLNRFLCDDAIC